MGRKPNTEVRREQITRALGVEIAAAGYERTSIKSIAARAGLTSGLIHYHFKDKLEILLALVDSLIEEAEGRLQTVLSADRSARQKLEAFVTARVGLGPQADPTQVKAWLTILAEAIGQPKVRTRVATWLAQDAERLAALFKDAGAARPPELAAALMAIILGSFSLRAVQVPGIPSGYAERQILAWLATALPDGPAAQ